MRVQIYNSDGVELFKDGAKYYIRYDAGSHQIAIREDEISEDEAKRVMVSSSEATRVLFALQERLTRQGIDSYVSNT